MEFNFHQILNHHKFQIIFNELLYICQLLILAMQQLQQFYQLLLNYLIFCIVSMYDKDLLVYHQFLLLSNQVNFILNSLIYIQLPIQSYQEQILLPRFNIILMLSLDLMLCHNETQPYPIIPFLHNTRLLSTSLLMKMLSYCQHNCPFQNNFMLLQKPPPSSQP